ncbi:MAG: hypothetical protein HGA80_09715, partial [Candidatus Omnitrophica bacterium]|nr:hypothetical protein [Candidatus Omnitrophota bacterium]
MKTIFQYLPSRLAIVTLLVISLILPVNYIAAQPLTLPPAGDKVVLSTSFQPQMLSAITVDIQNPAQFDFYIDEGQEAAARAHMSAEAAREDYLLLVKDFLVALTIPEDQLWVNLSPYEKDRIIDDRFGQTDMGRDLLAQDYLLKQLTASLLFPEDGTGKAFWDELYSRAHERFGSTDIPVETFNKVWIMPESAEVYQKGPSALVVKGHLKVLLEADYLAMQQSAPPGSVPALAAAEDDRQVMAKQVMRDVVIPVLEKEVNEG